MILRDGSEPSPPRRARCPSGRSSGRAIDGTSSCGRRGKAAAQQRERAVGWKRQRGRDDGHSHAYFASVRFVDEQIGAILSSWRRHAAAELSHTLVLFVADHGDALGWPSALAKRLPARCDGRACLRAPMAKKVRARRATRGSQRRPVGASLWTFCRRCLMPRSARLAARARALCASHPREAAAKPTWSERRRCSAWTVARWELLRRVAESTPGRGTIARRRAIAAHQPSVLELGEPSPPCAEWMALSTTRFRAQRNGSECSAPTVRPRMCSSLRRRMSSSSTSFTTPSKRADLALGLNQSEARRCAEATPGGLARAAETLAMWRQRLVEQFQSVSGRAIRTQRAGSHAQRPISAEPALPRALTRALGAS